MSPALTPATAEYNHAQVLTTKLDWVVSDPEVRTGRHTGGHQAGERQQLSGAHASGQPHKLTERPFLQVSLLAAKFLHEDKPEFINYIAFSCTVDPPERCANA